MVVFTVNVAAWQAVSTGGAGGEAGSLGPVPSEGHL